MATRLTKTRGKNGAIIFKENGRTIDVHRFVDLHPDHNIYTALIESKDVKQLTFLKQSLGQHSGTGDTRKKIDSQINQIKKQQADKKRQKEAFATLGLTQDVIDNLTKEEKSMLTSLGVKKLESIDKQMPIIDPLSPKVLKEIREQAKNDPSIKKYERDTIARLTEATSERLESMQFETDQFADQFERRAEEMREVLAQNAESLGQTFSPMRQQEVQELENQEQGIIASFAQSQQQSLQNIGRNLEDSIGSENVSKMGDLLSLDNTLTGGRVNYNASATERTFQDSTLGREVGGMQRDLENIEVGRIETLAGIR